MNHLYISPEFEIRRIEIIEDILTGSLETGGSTPVIGGDDWGDNGGGSGGGGEPFDDIFA